MTSAVTMEDIRAELYKAGIRSSFILSRLTTMITIYTLAEVRKAAPLEDAFTDSYGYLMPGDYDLDSHVTRCAKCDRPKAWSHFGIDRTHPTGHKVTCKPCLRVRPVLTEDERRWKCPGCDKKKAPGEFSENKRKNPRVREKCLSCQKTIPA